MFVIAGPCAAETRQQVFQTAEQLAAMGVRVFRAGVWKPRSQPGHFEGVGEEALRWLAEASLQYNLPFATEVANAEQVALALRYGASMLWIGARTTTNPFLVQAIADALHDYLSKHPEQTFSGLSDPGAMPTVLVKNPMSPDVNLWQGAIERIAAVVGQSNVQAIHRGFQTGAPSKYRNAPMWQQVFELRRRMPSMPLIFDASHMAGDKVLIPELCRQAVDLGYTGLMLEVHCRPEEALSDAQQQLTPAEMQALVQALPERKGNADMGLAELRHQIDETDDAIWELIRQRMQVSAEIGAYKREHDIPVLQSGRFQALTERRLEWARQHGISEEAVRAILNALHEESCKHQF